MNSYRQTALTHDPVRCYDRAQDPHMQEFFQKHQLDGRGRRIELSGEVSCGGISFAYSRFGVPSRGMEPSGDTYRATTRYDRLCRTTPALRPRSQFGIPALDPSQLAMARTKKFQVSSILSSANVQHTHKKIRNVELRGGAHPDHVQTVIDLPRAPPPSIAPNHPAGIAQAIQAARSRSQPALLCNGTAKCYDGSYDSEGFVCFGAKRKRRLRSRTPGGGPELDFFDRPVHRPVPVDSQFRES